MYYQSSVTHLGSIDDAHVHASFAGMVQEGAVEAAPHRLVAPEGEGNVGDAPTDLAARALPLDLPGGTDEVHSIVVVLRHAGTDSEDVGVEDDVFRVEAHLLHQNPEGSGADAHLVLSCGRLRIANNINNNKQVHLQDDISPQLQQKLDSTGQHQRRNVPTVMTSAILAVC